MKYITKYLSPCGGILLAADQTGLTGLWFEGQKYFAAGLDAEHEEKETPVLKQAKDWLDIYFSGRKPDFSVPLHFTGTDFQNKVWELLCSIPYGETKTYGELAEQFMKKHGHKTSPRAVGSAVGHNRISIIVPCHRILGAGGDLTGYAGGIDRKKLLLELETGFCTDRPEKIQD